MTKTPAAKSFSAILERDNAGLGWVIIRIPFDAAKFWKARGRIRVRGEINGFPFRTTLFPDGKGGHTLLVNKKMQKAARVVAGLSAKFRLQLDAEERPIIIPAEVEKYFTKNKSLRAWFGKLNPSLRRVLCDQIREIKNPAARARRAEQMAEHLFATMEAERELPPILQMAFTRDPRARQGWNLMTPTQRRGHLFGICGYKSPESRGRRAQKAIDQALETFEKKTSGRNA